ncbi:MAG TPA: CoA transferase [Geminicoccaceae bacterium]
MPLPSRSSRSPRATASSRSGPGFRPRRRSPSCGASRPPDCAADEQFRFRGMVREVEDAQLGRVLHPGIVPHIRQAPGAIRWAGPAIGAHNEEVLGGLLGLSGGELAALRKEGVC